MLLKEIYDSSFLKKLTKTLLLFDKNFDQKKFLAQKNWEEKSLKERMRAISAAMQKSFSSQNYRWQIDVLKKTAQAISKDKNSSLALIILPDFVEVFGLDDFDFSMRALEFFTEFGSSEFAVRQFIKRDQKRALKFIQNWTTSKNHHVRRLASEGCRPRLPWGEALPVFKKNPQAILEILENLKFDNSAYVAKSVANNLNDISKDNPDLVLKILTRWKKEKISPSLIKHALRTLLKKGNKEALALIGVKKSTENFLIRSFALRNSTLKISQDLIFDFTFQLQAKSATIRIEYAIFFLRKDGLHGKKIFQITTKNFSSGVFSFSKKHSFRDLSTRKHNAGEHFISLVVNGIESQKLQFHLTSK